MIASDLYGDVPGRVSPAKGFRGGICVRRGLDRL
jgi:hypothetical protein